MVPFLLALILYYILYPACSGVLLAGIAEPNLAGDAGASGRGRGVRILMSRITLICRLAGAAERYLQGGVNL